MAIKHDAVTTLIFSQINSGLEQINAANEILLAEDKGTPSREIDSVLKADAAKETHELPAPVIEAWVAAQDAYKIYREQVEFARNTYRTEILGEEAVADDEVDKEALKEIRKTVMESLSFLKTYATSQGKTDIIEWANNVSVPQVGRQGSSSVTGTSKPRVFVKDGETIYDSFTKAALAFSGKDADGNVVKVTAGDLAESWMEQTEGKEGDFKFGEKVLNVTFKPKKAA